MSHFKRKLTFLIVALALAATAAGAYAATQTSGSSSRQAFLNDVAHRLHVTPSALRSALQGAFDDRLAAAVAAGRLSKAQASAIEQRMKKTGAVGFGGGFGMYPAGPGMHPGAPRSARAPWAQLFAPGGARGPKAFGRAAPGPGAFGKRAMVPAGPIGPWGFAAGLVPAGGRAVLTYLRITAAKLHADLRAGKSLAQIATAQGKSAHGLESAIEAAIATRLSHLVASKRLSSAQASRLRSSLDSRVAGIVNGKLPKTFPRVRWFRRPAGSHKAG